MQKSLHPGVYVYININIIYLYIDITNGLVEERTFFPLDPAFILKFMGLPWGNIVYTGVWGNFA